MSDDLIRTFTDVYPSFVQEKLAGLGLDDLQFAPAIAEGRAWLEQTLRELAATPFVEQRRGPLEIFQDAMRFPTAALVGAGVQPIARDETAANALPGDLFGLAPASSQELGEDAWRVHMEWGMHKAEAMTKPPKPRIGYIGASLMDRSKIETAAAGHGFELAVYRSVAELADPPGTVIIDLEFSASDEAIRAAVDAGATVIAFGPHVDDLAMVRARSLGAATVVPRSRFFRDMAQYFPTIA